MSTEIDTVIDALVAFRRGLVAETETRNAAGGGLREALHRLRFLNRRVRFVPLTTLLDAAEQVLERVGERSLEVADVERLMTLAADAERGVGAHPASMPVLYAHSISFAGDFVDDVAALAATPSRGCDLETLKNLRDRLSVLQRGAAFLCEDEIAQRISQALAGLDAAGKDPAGVLDLKVLGEVGAAARDMFAAAAARCESAAHSNSEAS